MPALGLTTLTLVDLEYSSMAQLCSMVMTITYAQPAKVFGVAAQQVIASVVG